MNIEDVHIGDVLRIRDWDDMAAEFNITEDRWIPTRFVFLPSMKHFCGKVITVKSIGGERIYPSESLGCILSADMLEPVFAYEEDTPDACEFIDITSYLQCM